MTDPEAHDMSDRIERKRFEAWVAAFAPGKSTFQIPEGAELRGGQYKDRETHFGWEAWQAALTEQSERDKISEYRKICLHHTLERERALREWVFMAVRAMEDGAPYDGLLVSAGRALLNREPDHD